MVSVPPATADPRSLDRQIWALAGPAVLTLASEPLYLLADTAIVSRIGTEALGGLAVATAILLFASGMLVFLTFGTAATVARLIGSGDPDEAAEQSVQGLWLGGLLGVVVALALWPLSGWLIGLFGAEPAVVDEARTYLLVSLWGMPAVTIAMAGAGARRGHLDTRTPLGVAVATNSLNLALEVWLVLGLDWGIAGSALGTVVAKWVAAAAYTAIVAGAARTRGVGLAPDRGRITRLAVVGRDLFVRTVALRAGLSVTVAAAARKGTAAVAAYQVAFQVWTFCAYLLDALEAAAQSLVARALGGSDAPLARTTARRILAWAVGVGCVVGLAVALGSSAVAGWFTDDPEVLALLTSSLVWVGLTQPLSGVAFALDGILVGAGDQRFLALAMVASSLVLVGAMVVVWPASVGLGAVWAGFTVFMATRVGLLGWRWRTGRWVHLGAVAR